MSAITSAVQGFDLPDTWRRKRIKYVATYNDEALSDDTDEFKHIEYIEISSVSLVGGVESTSELQFHAAPSRARRVVRSGDTLVSTVRTYLKAIATVPEAADNLIASTGFCVIRPGEEIDAAFLGWAMKSEPIVGEIVARSVGVSYPATNASEVVKLEVPLPDLDTQRRIAGYLNDKTARIDALIEKKRALLDRLAEKRQALITRAVTHGLNPSAPLKDSGIDWLGKVPAHWSVEALGYRYQVQLGRMLNAERAEGDNLRPYLRVNDVQWRKISISDLPMMDFPPEAQERYRLEPGDLLINEGGSYVGRSAIWRGELAECYYQKALHRARPLNDERDTAEFLYFIMEMATQRSVFIAGGNQTTIDHLTAEQLRAYRLPFPPLAEQEAIVAFLEPRIQTFEALDGQVNRSIERLTEYRAALVTTAVTGKVKALLTAPTPAAIMEEA